MSDAQIANVISNGVQGTGMPAFHALSPAQVKNLVSYIHLLQGKVASRKLPGDASRGKAIFFGKAECSTCHAVSGEGGFIGPDLTGYGENINPSDVLKALADSNRVVPVGYRFATVTTGDGSRVEGVVRNEDNFSLQLQDLDGAFHLLAKSDIKRLEYNSQSMMPSNYGSTLSSGELNDVISYLMNVANGGESGTPQAETPKENPEED